jgi:hypothetical protein
MAIYSLGETTIKTFPLYLGAVLEIIPSALSRISLMEFSFCGLTPAGGGNSPRVGLGFPAANGIGQQNLSSFVPDDPAEAASGTQIAIDWVTAPVPPAQFLRRFISGNIGSGQFELVIWRFPRGLKPALGGTIAHFVTTVPGTSSSIDISVAINE